MIQPIIDITQPNVQPSITTDPSRAFPVVGIIMSVQGAVVLPSGGRGYYTQGTSYTISAAIPEHGVMILPRQIPQIRMWSVRSEILLDAESLVGCAVNGVWVGGSIRWNFYEPPAVSACSTGGGGATPTGDIPPRVREPLPEIFSPVSGGGGGGPTETPAPGDGDV